MKPAWPATIVRQRHLQALLPSPPLPLPQMLLQWLPSPLLPLLPHLSLPLPLLSRQSPVARLPSVPLPRLSLLVPLLPLPLQGARAGAVSCNVPFASVSLYPPEKEQGRCLEASLRTFGSDSVRDLSMGGRQRWAAEEEEGPGEEESGSSSRRKDRSCRCRA